MSFSEKLQKLRHDAKMSQEQLADMLDVTRQSVSKWESGMTYPEMDKLIEISRIFNCTLDDLTNDNIKDISVTEKKSTSFNSIIDSFLEIINKTVKMVKSMNTKELIGAIIRLIALAIILNLFKYPFNSVESSIRALILNLGETKFTLTIAGLFDFIIDIIYTGLYIFTFFYIYKIAYLDKYEFIETKSETKKIEIEKKEIDEKKEIKVVHEKKNDFAIFQFIGAIIIGFLRLFLFFFSLPLVFMVISLFALFAISIYLLFSGVLYLGGSLIILSSASILIVMLEVLFTIIFDKKISFKRVLWTFLISVVSLGLSSGLFAMEISNTKYIDSEPNISKNVLNKEVDMANTLYIYNDAEKESEYYHYYSNANIEYIEDNNLTNKIKLEVKYIKDYQTVNIIEQDNKIIVQSEKDNEITLVSILYNTFINDLKNKEIHNYNDIDAIEVKIYGNKDNIAILKNNAKIESKRLDENIEQEKNNSLNSEIERLNDIIENYNWEIQEYRNTIEELTQEKENLEQEKRAVEQDFNTYKSRVNSIINNE